MATLGGGTPPPEEDLAGGDTVADGIDARANLYINQVQIRGIQRLRNASTVVAILVLVVLSVALLNVVFSYTGQIRDPATDVKTEPVTTPVAIVPVVPEKAEGLSKSPTVVTKPSGSVQPAPSSTKTTVTVDLSPIATSVVAVVTVLVLALSVISISIMRFAYTVPVDMLGKRSPTDESVSERKVDDSVPIVGFEAIKILSDTLTTLIKGVAGKKD